VGGRRGGALLPGPLRHATPPRAAAAALRGGLTHPSDV